MRPVPPQPSGKALVLLSAAVTLQLARGRSLEELELLSAFFSALGEQLWPWWPPGARAPPP